MAEGEEEEDQGPAERGRGGSWVLWMIFGGRSVRVVDDGWVFVICGDWTSGGSSWRMLGEKWECSETCLPT